MADQTFAQYFTDLDEDEAARIVMMGIDMMRTITEIYGAERGEKLYNEMTALLGKEARHAIFTAALMGVSTNVINVTRRMYVPGDVNKIMAIKAVRAATGMGLKEAKEEVESWYGQSGARRLKVPREQRNDFVQTIREAGYEAA